MRRAWAGALQLDPPGLIRTAMSGFKANWRERRRAKAILRGSFGTWRAAARRNSEVRVLAQRIKEVRGVAWGCGELTRGLDLKHQSAVVSWLLLLLLLLSAEC